MAASYSLSQRAHRAGGQPIGHLMHLALSRPELVSLAAGFVDSSTLPQTPTQQAVAEVLADKKSATAALQYGTTAGYLPLRQQILDRLVAADGHASGNLSTDHIMLTAGSNSFLHLLADTVLDPGDIVLCASPTYFVFLGVLSNLGARAVGVATDEQGMQPEALEEQLRRIEAAGELQRVKAIYVITSSDNPASTTLALDRRPQLVEIARRWSKHHQILVIEDAAYRELRYSGDDLPSLLAFDDAADTVVHAGTFSKSYSPGVRVGWGIVPKGLWEPLKHQKGNIDFGSPNLSQYLMSKVMELGLYQPHIEHLKANYQLKLQAMLAAADKYLAPIAGVHYSRPQGGLYVWLTLPEHIDTGPSGPLLDRALNQGMLYVPGCYCFPSEGQTVQQNCIRLSFGDQSPEKIDLGIQMLANAIHSL